MSSAYYVRWKAGEPRGSRLYPPLTQSHPSYAQLCAACRTPLGDGRSVRLYAMGPYDEATEQRHNAGRWYTALAELLHADCVVLVAVGAECDGE